MSSSPFFYYTISCYKLQAHYVYGTIQVGGDSMSDLTTRVRIGNAIDKKLFEQLKQLSEKTMIPMSKLLDRGIELVLAEYKKPTKK
jgi:hypothetical protein